MEPHHGITLNCFALRGLNATLCFNLLHLSTEPNLVMEENWSLQKKEFCIAEFKLTVSLCFLAKD